MYERQGHIFTDNNITDSVKNNPGDKNPNDSYNDKKDDQENFFHHHVSIRQQLERFGGSGGKNS